MFSGLLPPNPSASSLVHAEQQAQFDSACGQLIRQCLPGLLVIGMLASWNVAASHASDAQQVVANGTAQADARAIESLTNDAPSTVAPSKDDAKAEDTDADAEETATLSQSTGITTKELLDWIPADKVTGSLHLAVSMTILGLVPALLLMTTSYVRISVVLALLRQAFGIPNLLPMQATTALALFCTGWIMWPTWQLVHRQAVLPMMSGQSVTDPEQLWFQGIGPIREFMVRQIEANHNADDVHLFLQRSVSESHYPTSYDEVPLAALLPAFLLSELKTAFIIGFKIYLPFLVIDLVVSAITTSMGLFMMPPSMLSMPLKLLLFVLVDGWHLVVEMLLLSFQ